MIACQRWCLFLLALSFLGLSGCGKRSIIVNGKVVRNGQPFQLGERGMFIISFHPEDSKDEKTYATDTKADGTFTVVGPDRKGIPPGKYKVAVEAMDPYDKRVDKLNGKFTHGKTSLVVDVTGPDVTVDVGK